MSYISNPVLFNGTNLETVEGLTVLATDPYRPPKRTIHMSDLIRTDKSVHNSANSSQRLIAIRVGITRTSRELLQASIDTLMRIIQPINKILLVPQGTGRRKYYCTYSDSDVDKDGGSYIEITLLFECSDRNGYNENPTLLASITGYTSANRTDLMQFGGSTLWQQAVITITYTSVTGGTNKTVLIGNSNTGEQVSITRNWVSGDLLQVGWYAADGQYVRGVRVNGVETDFTGAIPEWNPGSGYWDYADDFTARTFSGSVRQVYRYV
jgi:hypothetical protein